MKDNVLKKILQHPEKDDVIAKLSIDMSPKDINQYLREKYGHIDKSLVLSIKQLSEFKNEYLDLYTQIRQDAMELKMDSLQNNNVELTEIVQNNSMYRQKLAEYLDKEIDLKEMVKNLIVAAEARIEQIYNIVQENPKNMKPDYVMLGWVQTITTLLEKQNAIVNGSTDKIVQQNTINIQILDQHIGVFHKVIREVISRLDDETSLVFIDILNEELRKLKAPTVSDMPSVDVRLTEARRLEESLYQLDIPDA